MQYEELSAISRSEFSDSISSCNPGIVARGLLRMALHETELSWAEAQCLSALSDDRLEVRKAAIQGLGHLARIHGKLTNPGIADELGHLRNDPELGGIVEDTLDDILVFTGHEGPAS